MSKQVNLQILIEEVKKRPCIYDFYHIHYKNYQKKANAWQEVGAILNAPVPDIKIKWKKLRDCFRSALYRRSNKVAGSLLQPWAYESRMQFLRPFLTGKPPVIEYKPSHSVKDISDTVKDFRVAANDINDAEKDIVDVEEENDAIDNIIIEDPRSVKTDRKSNFPSDRRYDDLDYFFASACESTRKLPRLQQLKVKQEILYLITSIEEEYLLTCGSMSEEMSYSRPPSRSSNSNSDMLSLFHPDVKHPSASEQSPETPNHVKIEMVELEPLI